MEGVGCAQEGGALAGAGATAACSPASGVAPRDAASSPSPLPWRPPPSRFVAAARLMNAAAAEEVLRLPAQVVDAAVAEVQRGAHLLKFGRSGRPQKRFVRVTDEGDALYWVSQRKKRADSTREFARAGWLRYD